MKKWIFPLLLFCGFINLSAQSLLFNRATSEHTIVIPAQPTEMELYAASEMQKFLNFSGG
jgi:hypothetical protein